MATVARQTAKDQTVQKVRAALVARGSSLHRWCLENGVDTSNARLALSGRWDGPKARLLRSRLLSEAGVEE